jgi:S1-C subfamily serine protease
LDDEYRKQNDIDKRINGLVVTEVDPKSPYHDRLAVGVIILEINRQPVTTVPEARAALAKGNNLYCTSITAASCVTSPSRAFALSYG